MSLGARLRKILSVTVCGLIGLVLHGWSASALYYCIFSQQSGMRIIPAALYLLGVMLFIILRRNHMRAFFISLLGFVCVALWFSSIQPETGGVYPPELTLPHVDFGDNEVKIHNVRNCDYRTLKDFDVRYETRTYSLKDLKSMDIMVNYWGMSAIAHTFLSFGFADGRYLAVSVEIRPEVGKAYDMLQGFFKQYQLIYIWADERDLVRLRTNYKKENVYLYRARFTDDEIRKMFMGMLRSTDTIYHKPEFYNTLTHSCTNTLGNHIIEEGIRRIPIWKRRVLTGDVDQRLYANGLLVDYGLSFSELRKRANIDQRAQAADQDSDFSRKIRTHLKNSL